MDFTHGAEAAEDNPTGVAGSEVGSEIDLLVNFHLAPYQDITVGYSELFAGEFIRKTGPGQNADLLYVLMTTRW